MIAKFSGISRSNLKLTAATCSDAAHLKKSRNEVLKVYDIDLYVQIVFGFEAKYGAPHVVWNDLRRRQESLHLRHRHAAAAIEIKRFESFLYQ